ncbi:hypothetical protein CGCF415_v006613 [Colletotrichum fructicola]|uniref:DUF7580 domain-containing protein n=1 Tax=Colletotrichum fructicola (strain Nara gc5) TaxID=1213859 RepID=L2FFH9_COLFN|nr:uncharacterized protein CGMCC3_g12152 [Colletotrichum fructicola]KAF4482029.1 hypothetical protein CGGC5_v009658 [Colletotrichum fructicola Nara gc5]KAE9571649.1 hypothetical protein CGMCC3_g12152 [Colletotrichum fructicola]KAF4424696.1 hypothetical protein CFRS1_v012971 [Colletotrichum fructicola]KAF4886015.1 hypothetical protein CGCFRS4_v011475 [Colletotrichum fructicola]KAF4908322.1 hypothetical protein CGCF415_v006613 [Colletotrichum fructicola]
MSGFEVAGVVLGTIPLVISALEHYKQGISTIRTWRNYNRELRILILSLETERVRFQDVCEKLLVGLVSPCQIESMVEDPFGPAWQEDVIQAKIKARLWRSFSIFEDIVTDMEEATKEMMKKLDLQPDGKIKWQEATFVIREFKRASFVLKRSDHAEQMTTIKDGITSLESLIDRNIKMEPERKLRSQGRLMRLVRELSASVYRALRSSFQCSCAHEVHLGLVSRSVELAQKDEDEDVIQKLAFQLALTYDKIEKTANDEKEPCERVAWEEVRVQALPKATAQTLTSVGRTSKTKMPGMGKSKSVSFTMSHSATATTTCIGQTSTMVVQQSFSSLSISSSNLGLHDHINLCERIRRSQKQLAFDCYGMIRDRSGQMCRDFGVYPTFGSDREQWSVISLREVLERPLEFPHMSVSAKLHLAAMIASSFLQLHQTPWLPEILTSRDILFFKRGAELQYEHAFVMKGLQERLEDKQKGNNSAPSSRCPALLALGILLLELNLGRTIESLRIQYETPPPGAPRLMYDSMTAQRLLQERQMDSLNYKSAVQRCIGGEFARPKLDLNDEDFRQEIYEKVVALLETDLKNATWSYDVGI